MDGGNSARLGSLPPLAGRLSVTGRHGGLRGLEVLEQAWTPAPSTVWNADLARARTALAAAWDGDLPELRVWRNRLTVTEHGLQLRYGRDERWYPYREQRGDWWPAGPPERDPAAVLALDNF